MSCDVVLVDRPADAVGLEVVEEVRWVESLGGRENAALGAIGDKPQHPSTAITAVMPCMTSNPSSDDV